VFLLCFYALLLFSLFGYYLNC